MVRVPGLSGDTMARRHHFNTWQWHIETCAHHVNNITLAFYTYEQLSLFTSPSSWWSQSPSELERDPQLLDWTELNWTEKQWKRIALLSRNFITSFIVCNVEDAARDISGLFLAVIVWGEETWKYRLHLLSFLGITEVNRTINRWSG